jgi:IclR family acetate operon transcriptional repressor
MVGAMPSTPGDESTTPNYPIGSVDSALRLLLMLGEQESVRLADAAKELDVARSTAHRLMQMLQYHGLARQDPLTRAYVVGSAMEGMGLRILGKLDVPAVARPFMEELVTEIQETVALMGRRTDTELLCLDSVESPRALRVSGRTGLVVRAHASASGRALLSTLTDEAVARIYPRAELRKHQAAGISTRRDLLDELHRIREIGYATQRDETEPGVSAIAAVVPAKDAMPNLVLTVMVPTSRLADDDIPRVGEAVARKALHVASALPF